MARTISTGQEDLLYSNKYGVHTRVEVENSTGSMVNLSNLSSADWIKSLRWNWDINQTVPELTFGIRRDHAPTSSQSLAPLYSDSTFNQNSTGGHGAAVYPGRSIHVYTAITAAGASAPASSAYDFVFQGEIDEVAWEASPMEGVARSEVMSRVQDRWIRSSSYSYGNSTGILAETVISTILADWTNLSTSILLTPTSPGFAVAPAYSPEKQRVLDAITAVAMLPGFSLQEVWSTASTSWRIKFSEPNRDATSSEKNWTFGPEHYYDVTLMSVSREDVRNYISGIFGPSTNRQQVIVQSTSSQDAYELQFMEFEEAVNSAIATSSEMETLLNAALGDLKEPYATHEIELPYFYPVELGDFIEFEANGVHYSSNQYLAVVGVTHELGTNRQRTRIKVRGKPAGQRLQWFDYKGGGSPSTAWDIVHIGGGVTANTTALSRIGSLVRIPGNMLPPLGTLHASVRMSIAQTSTFVSGQVRLRWAAATSVAFIDDVMVITLNTAASSVSAWGAHGVASVSRDSGDDLEASYLVTYTPPVQGGIGLVRSTGIALSTTAVNINNDTVMWLEASVNPAADTVAVDDFRIAIVGAHLS